ncbi:MAG: tetratricopeptide repeat protein [Opitutaceae bacterium]
MITTTPLILLPGCTRRAAAFLTLFGCLHLGQAETPASPSISELMEIGVYSEETKGDLDAAMKVYQQVIDDAKTSQSIAAQALFRLAICHDKKGDLAAAAKTFERLVKEFPAEKDLVAAASDYLADGAALLPAPWADREETCYEVKLPSGVKAGFGRYTVEGAERDGRKTWRFTSLVFAGNKNWSRLDVESGSMKPIHSEWRNLLLGSAQASYSAGKVDVDIRNVGRRNLELSGVVYDNEEAIHLIRRLPLAAGFKKTINVFVSLSGLAIPVEVAVVGTEQVTVAAGTFECYKVVLSLVGGQQTFWYSTAPRRHLIRFEANGVSVETNSIRENTTSSSVDYREPTLGFRVTVPAGSIFRRDDGPDSVRRQTVQIVDAEARGVTFVKVEPQANFDPATVASLRAFADHQIAMGKKFVQQINVRPDTWQETTVDGQPALTVVADQVQGPVKAVVHIAFALIGGNAVDISSTVSPEDAESYRPRFDELVASYRAQ